MLSTSLSEIQRNSLLNMDIEWAIVIMAQTDSQVGNDSIDGHVHTVKPVSEGGKHQTRRRKEIFDGVGGMARCEIGL
jgi:hypothetical protein